MSAPRRWAGILLLLLPVLTGCASASALAAQPTIQPTETPVPLVTPTLVPVPPPVDLPAVDWKDVSIHKKAMKPEFAGDVDRFVDANRYLIIASLRLEPDAIIRGAARIRYTNQTPDSLPLIVFRLYPNTPALGGRMNVTRVTANGKVVDPSLSELASVMGVPLEKPLAPGESIELTVDFNVAMTRGLNTSYGRFGYVNDVVSSTAWYPTLSVYEPGKGWWVDLPPPQGDPAYSEIGLYDVRLNVPASMTVAMSGTIIERTDLGDGTITYRDVTGPMRDHAFQASDRYMITSQDADGTRINVAHYKETAGETSDGTPLALQYGVQSVLAFNKAFGQYPYLELDIVQNPTPSGVEFPGLVQIAQSAWVRGNQFLEVVIAHEVGHQWFYALIGNDQVNRPWLDESITSYSEIVYMRAVYTPSKVKDTIDRFRRRYQQYVGSGRTDQPLSQPVGSYMLGAYGAIVYAKGALFFAELERQFGYEMVYKALAEYFQRRKYQVARTEDVQDAFEMVIGSDLDEIFAKWVTGTGGAEATPAVSGTPRPTG